MVYTVTKKTQCKICNGSAYKHAIPRDGKLVDCDGYIREEVTLAEALKYELNLLKLKETLIDK